MPKRLNSIWKGQSLNPTALTMSLLNLQINEESNKDQSFVQNDLSIEEIIYQKETLQDKWDRINSDNLIESIDKLLSFKTVEFSKHAHTKVELWLLKALAQEKSFFLKANEIYKTYLFCLRGRFLSSLVYNNLGVIEARRQNCFPALDMFKNAIIADKDNKEKAIAPYYNFFSIIVHLKENNFLSFNSNGKPIYKDIVEQLHHLLFPNKLPKQKTTPNEKSKMQPSPLTDDEVLELSREIFIFSRTSKTASKQDFFSDKFHYLVPKVELLNSFGDVWNQESYEIAEKYFEIGNDYLSAGNFKEAINKFNIAKLKNPSIEIKADVAISQAMSLWQIRRNSEILNASLNGRYDLAINLIEKPIDEKLKLDTDGAVASNILEIKINNLIKEVDKLRETQPLTEQHKEHLVLRYLEILQEDKLTPAQREYISWRIDQISD